MHLEESVPTTGRLSSLFDVAEEFGRPLSPKRRLELSPFFGGDPEIGVCKLLSAVAFGGE